ncbi:hypothetical protein ACFL4B_02985 [Candidatus Neomarinimicrobiota bacterium]
MIPIGRILILNLILLNIVFGQFSTNLTVNTYNDDNLFRTPDVIKVQDVLSTFTLGLSYRDSESRIQLHNNTNFMTYQNNSIRNFLINNVGLNKSIPIKENSTSNINLGGNWSLRVNQDDYNYYNYSQLSGYVNFQLLTNIILIKGGYSYRWRNYSNWPDLSNYLHNAHIQFNKSFLTRTTLIVEAGFGNKSFFGQDTFTTIGSTGHGNGRWAGETSTSITNTISERLSISQVNIILRLTQSLHEKAGIYFQYRKQISLDDETSYRNFADYYQDNELFDDPFTYASDGYSTQLTLMLPKSTKLLVGGTLSLKNYVSELAYSTADDMVGIGDFRFDDQTNYFIDLSKTFNIDKNWVNSIKLNLYYSNTINESNSYWYNYKNTSWGGGIQWSF